MKHSARLILILALVGITAMTSYSNEFGGDLKTLGAYVENTADLDDDSNDSQGFLRMEGHLWFQSELEENVKARVSLEFDRSFSDEDGILADTGSSYQSSDELDVKLEEALIQVADPFDQEWPVTVTIGRQFIQLGTGFIVGDSLPSSPANLNSLGEGEQDPFDAIVIGWGLSDAVDLTLAYTKACETRDANEDIDAAIANLGWKASEDVTLEMLYMYYNDDTAFDAEIHTLGLRGNWQVLPALNLNGEFAWQFAGEVGSLEQDVDGGIAAEIGAKLTPESMAESKTAFGFSVTWIGGDDASDQDDYDRFVQLVDNRMYGEIADYYQNLAVNNVVDFLDPFTGVFVFNLDAETTLASELRLAAEIYYFLAEEDVNDVDDQIGWEVDLYADYPLTEDLKAHAAAGFFEPEDGAEACFGSDDTALFARAGITVSF